MKQVSLLDICVPDYFTGYHLPVLSVPLQGTVTCGDMAELIEDELNATYDYINPECDPAIDVLYDTYIADLKEKDNEIFYESESDEDIECVYAYFSVINPVRVYGLTFLNG